MADQFSLSRINKVDKSKVYAVYRSWPDLALQGFDSRAPLGGRRFKRVLVLGMGGSAAGGDIVAGWLRATRLGEMWVCKGYISFLDLKDTLAIACSVSGNTDETVSMMKIAASRGATIVSISSGGRVGEESERSGYPHIRMPPVLAPRFNLPFIVFSCLSVANQALGVGCEVEAAAAIRGMRSVAKEFDTDSPAARNGAKRIARAMLGKTPAIYGTTVTRGAAVRFKNVLNENAKKHALVDVMPEMFHNEVETWEHPNGHFLPVLLRHSLEEASDRRRADSLTKILARLGRGPVTVRGEGKSSLEELATMVYELDMASYYVAVGLGRDPLPTKLIEELKAGP